MSKTTKKIVHRTVDGVTYSVATDVPWQYRTDAVTSTKGYATPQQALNAAVKAGDWWSGAEKSGGWIRIEHQSGNAFLDADELVDMLRGVK